ncbi:hypothetical protein PE36_12762 [Moritella sp. PE36]|uniref:hypothetical protein n=1 Tax=Moritella sp. PE36 TaxID=58051 RepID=UPI00015689A2|nr:hypothetical protein [Moritella sp. PE36]EDM67317.1 hypothetical protein PE36_12762 [Moritella sp. PE36]
MKNWLHDKCSVIFWLTLAVYALTLYFVSYVGVFLTYIAVPTIVITGFIAYVTRPNVEQT